MSMGEKLVVGLVLLFLAYCSVKPAGAADETMVAEAGKVIVTIHTERECTFIPWLRAPKWRAAVALYEGRQIAACWRASLTPNGPRVIVLDSEGDVGIIQFQAFKVPQAI